MGAALSLTVIFLAVLSIPLATASELGLSSAQTTGWIMALYGVAGVLSVVLVLRYRQPLLVTGNVFVLIFIASLGRQLTWPELVGAAMVAGVLVLALGVFGLTDRIASWLPSPIVFGLLGGAVLPLFVGLFGALGDALLVVGVTLGVYLVAGALAGPRLPAILPALVAGLAAAGFAGDLGRVPAEMVWPLPAITPPEFTLRGILTATPVMTVLIAFQANVPSVVFLRSEGYRPPERPITIISGIGTALGSVLGPMGVSLSLPATALCAGPDAGDRAIRHRAAYIAGGTGILIALLAGFAVELDDIIPRPLLLAVVGLAVVNVLAGALREVGRGPLVLGPVFAFAIALSELSLLGLGPFFWALVGGLAVSLLTEREGWKASRDAGARTAAQ